MKDKQDIINILLACMDYNKKDDTWYIKSNRIDNLASDLEAKFNNVDLFDVNKCDHNYVPCEHEAIGEFDECTKCGKIK